MKPLLLALSLCTAIASVAPKPPAERALSPDASTANAAIAELREQGQAGVDALAAEIAKLAKPEDIDRARLALDKVCRQRDCYESRLFWFTDLDAAKAEAHRRGVPILSLRLLGNLDEDLSCANSRFFRTTLYSSPKIAAAMREQFVLHWSSERPVPQVTIDFGDGRTLHQTVTGNSIHYLLDENGRPIEALPGLYAPDVFLEKLGSFAAFAAAYRGNDGELRKYHAEQVQLANGTLGNKLETINVARARNGKAPRAIDVMPLAMTKAVNEATLLQALGQGVDDPTWKEMAAQAPPAQFAPESIALMRARYGLTDAKLAALQRSVAEDTLRNEYGLHAQLHGWFASRRAPRTLPLLNERVYAELFLTPRTDPWLGLQPEGFSAIANAGPTLQSAP